MQHKASLRKTLIVGGFAAGIAVLITAIGAQQISKKVTVQGTYKLVKRELPDGSTVAYPKIFGMLTLTEKYRNFNAYWTDEENRPFSISYVAEYTLTDTKYEEKSLYHMMNDESSGEGVSYELGGQRGSAPVTTEAGAITFPLPLYNEPTVVFKDGTLTATREGEFVDHWVLVK